MSPMMLLFFPSSKVLQLVSVLSLTVIHVAAIKRFNSDHFSFGRDLYEDFFESQEKQAQWANERNEFEQGHRHMVEDAESHLVTSIPLLANELSTKHYAGHIPASADDDKKLFYWFFYPDVEGHNVKDEDIPLLIWLNGGPGCSSMDGLFLENGPFRFDESDKQIYTNPYSWHKAPAYVLYIDQPVGTGLSFTKKKKYCKNDEEINIDFYFFLEQFMQLHSNVLLTQSEGQNKLKRPFFFSGESHAGHYIPSMMSYINSKNKGNPDILMPLSGGAIGNGWVDPYYQYSASDVSYGAGLIDLAQKAKLDQMEMKCHQDMTVEKKLASETCNNLQNDVLENAYGSELNYCVSPYDFNVAERKHVPRSFPPGHKMIEAYLGGWKSQYHPIIPSDHKDVLEAIHASESIVAKQRYMECTDPPYYALLDQDGLGVIDEVVEILDTGNIRLLFFNGMYDIICNHVGNERFLERMKWKGTKNWITSERYAWGNLQHGPAGYVKEYENLIFLKIRDAGHMVPLDQPRVSLDMITVFIYGLDFGQKGRAQASLKSIDDTVESGKDSQCEPCPSCEITSPETTEEVISKKSIPNDEFDPSEEYALNGSKFIAEGWIGAVVGAVAIIALFMWKQKRDREPQPVYNASDIRDLEETEMTFQDPYD